MAVFSAVSAGSNIALITSEGMATCPTCFATYSDDVKSCAKDGIALVPDATFAHVDRDIQPGTVVGEYTVESKLGQGGFGAVYRAVHPLIGKRAAVKVLSREFSSNPQMVSRFIAEARAVNQIRHRNIIDIFSFGQLPDGRQYYIMELLDGVTFDAYLSKKKRLDLAAAMPILRGVARALDAAHAKGILHRDLKPENVFLVQHDDGSVEPKLLDFGLVKLIDPKSTLTGDSTEKSEKPESENPKSDSGHNTKTGTPMGTPYYMSPEQCRGLEVDARTDVYSFGAMVFEVLTGELPFTGHSTLDILIQHMSSPPPAASSRCPDVPSSIDGPLAQIMAKDPNARPAHVGEALDFLARAAGIAVPVDSQRSFHIDSATMSAAERAVAPTIMAVGPSHPPASPVSTPAQTFLGTESSIAPPKKSRAPMFAALAALVVGAGIAVAITLDGKAPPAPVVAASTSAPAVAERPKEPEDVELRVDGAPEGTTVSADGVTLGTGNGPFKVKRGKSIALEFAAKGYKSKDLTIKPDENMLLSVTLEKAADKGPEKERQTAPATAPTTKPKIHKDLEGFDPK